MDSECHTCKGNKFVRTECKDLGGRKPYNSIVESIVNCPQCLGKGYLIDLDYNRVQSVEQYYQIIGPY